MSTFGGEGFGQGPYGGGIDSGSLGNGIIVSFVDVTPPARFDSVPWATAQINESTSSTGPWTLIDTLTIATASDPADPPPVALTTAKATLEQGWYTITFVDAHAGQSTPSDPIQNAPGIQDEIRPTVNDLGALMRARTVAAGSGGGEQGVFNDLTRPTGVEANILIDQAVQSVLMAIGTDIPAAYFTQTRWICMLYAAQLVEITFYRNEVNKDQSSYAQYEQLYKDGLTALKGAIADEDVASPAPSFWSVPVLNGQQARFQSIVNAINTETGILDPTLLPPDMYWPYGPGGIPAKLLAQWGWFGNGYGLPGSDLAWLEDGAF